MYDNAISWSIWNIEEHLHPAHASKQIQQNCQCSIHNAQSSFTIRISNPCPCLQLFIPWSGTPRTPGASGAQRGHCGRCVTADLEEGQQNLPPSTPLPSWKRPEAPLLLCAVAVPCGDICAMQIHTGHTWVCMPSRGIQAKGRPSCKAISWFPDHWSFDEFCIAKSRSCSHDNDHYDIDMTWYDYEIIPFDGQ